MDFLKQQHKLRGWVAETQKRMPGWLTEMRTLEKWLTLPIPDGAGSQGTATASDMKFDPAVESVRAFLRLANLCVSDAPPDRAWLEDGNLLKEAQAIIASSKSAFVRYKHNRQYLLQIYDAKLFDLDLIRIAQAYAGWYQNWLSIFSWQYRKDRRAIAKCRPSEVLPKSVAQDMQLGAQVLTDQAKLEAEQPQRSKLLGRYEKGLETEIEAAERAARVASEAAGVGPAARMRPLAGEVSGAAHVRIAAGKDARRDQTLQRIVCGLVASHAGVASDFTDDAFAGRWRARLRSVPSPPCCTMRRICSPP